MCKLAVTCQILDVPESAHVAWDPATVEVAQKRVMQSPLTSSTCTTSELSLQQSESTARISETLGLATAPLCEALRSAVGNILGELSRDGEHRNFDVMFFDVF